jgi:hypothetical protein
LRVRALLCVCWTANRQVADVPDAAVAADVLKARDRLRDLAAQLTLDGVLALDQLRDLRDLFVREFARLHVGIEAEFLADLDGEVGTHAVEITEEIFRALSLGMSTPVMRGMCFSISLGAA